MADIIKAAKRQSMAEVRIWDVDFSADLRSGAAVTDASATHTPPSGAASTPELVTIVGAVVSIKLGPLSVTGKHFLDVLAIIDDGEKSQVRLEITVKF